MFNSSCLTHFSSFSQYLGLGLMVGGMLALGAFTAPVLFKMFPRPEAGEAMTIIFRRYDTVLLVALALIVVGQVASWLTTGFPWEMGFSGWVRFGVFVALVVTMAYGTLIVSPKMSAMLNMDNFRDNATLQQEFRDLHKKSEKVYKLGMLLAVLMMFSLTSTGIGGCAVNFFPSADMPVDAVIPPQT